MSNYVYMGATPLNFSIPTTAFKPGAFSAKQLKEGRSYLTSQWRQSGIASIKQGAVFAQPKAVKKADGKVSVPITNFWSDWNREAAKTLRPVMSVLRNLDLPSFIDKRKLADRPLDFVLDVFDPVLDRFEAACNRTQKKHIPRGVVKWFGNNIDIRIDQPGDDRMDASTRNFMKTMRIIQSFILLFFNKPIELAAECLKEGVDLAGDVARDIGKAVDKTVKQVEKSVKKAGEEAEKAAAGVVDWLKGAAKSVGLGELATAGAGAGAAATTAAGGISIEVVIASVISSVTTALIAAIPEIITSVSQAAAEKGLPESDFSREPSPDELRAVDAGAVEKREKDDRAAVTPSSGGFPVLPVALAAGVALLLLTRR